MCIPAPIHSLEVPAPILFNLWKHHGRAVRTHIDGAAREGVDGLDQLVNELPVIGRALMDMYIGPLMPLEICQHIVSKLASQGTLDSQPYQQWITEGHGYRNIGLEEDGSVWTLRHAENPERYVHLHPGRHTPYTRRVRAHSLRTAILAHAHAAIHGGEPHQLEVVNEVRRRYLNLHPVKRLDPDEGILLMIETLQQLRD